MSFTPAASVRADESKKGVALLETRAASRYAVRLRATDSGGFAAERLGEVIFIILVSNI